jgi:EAL domain-containing protein (putative c-di-GMP-specific phosphodiesterase class I)
MTAAPVPDNGLHGLDSLHKLGVQVALDDSGAGASAFGDLKDLPVDFIRIDGQFIRDVVDGPLGEAALRCFVDVARAVGVVGVGTVAEFVDRPAVLERVRA